MSLLTRIDQHMGHRVHTVHDEHRAGATTLLYIQRCSCIFNQHIVRDLQRLLAAGMDDGMYSTSDPGGYSDPAMGSDYQDPGGMGDGYQDPNMVRVFILQVDTRT